MRIFSPSNIASLLFIITIWFLLTEPKRQKERDAHVDPIEATKEAGNSTATLSYVDLGLSIKWATSDLGSTEPNVAGEYYTWDNPTPISSQTEDTAESNAKNVSLNKDAARVALGGNWRLPTQTEMQELIDRCRWEQIVKTNKRGKPINPDDIRNFIGYKVTGPNGNFIILPYSVDVDNYWTSTSKWQLQIIINGHVFGGAPLVGEEPDLEYTNDTENRWWFGRARIRPVHP